MQLLLCYHNMLHHAWLLLQSRLLLFHLVVLMLLLTYDPLVTANVYDDSVQGSDVELYAKRRRKWLGMATATLSCRMGLVARQLLNLL